MRKFFLSFIIFSLLCFELTSQNKIGFFSSISDSTDLATISLTEDLYYSKASVISEFTIVDYRGFYFNSADISTYQDIDFIFYPEIQENGIGGWKCIFHGMNLKTKEKYESQKIYDSYYPILIDAKNDLSTFFTKLSTSSIATSQSTEKTSSQIVISIDSLAGTWQGEQFIDKIILLRSGRGFVIFNNGASMNISIILENSNLFVKQTSNANASFFPEIPREKALELAPTSKPVEWKFVITNLNEISGIKTTYILPQGSTTPVISDISVKWTKQ